MPSAPMIFCDECDSGTTRFERNWRAYLLERGGTVTVVILCPVCAERVTGEDEDPD